MTLGKRVIRQIQELNAGHRYAVVFNERLHQDDLEQLRAVCQGANVQVLILTGARVVPIEQVKAVVGEYADEVLPYLLDEVKPVATPAPAALEAAP